jgi:hypothetical protein
MDATQLTPRGTPPHRACLAQEAGAVAVSYLGILIFAAAVVLALVLATPGIGAGIADAVRAAVCQVIGTACPGPDVVSYEPDACVLETKDRSFGGAVKVTFVEVGKREGYLMEHRSDGEIHVTWVGSGTVGLTGGLGADGGIVLPTGDFRAGASASGEIHAGANVGETWVFAEQSDADAFIRARRNHAIRENIEQASPMTRIATGVNDLIRGGPSFPDPHLVYFETVLGASGSAGAGVGPAAVGGQVSGEAVVGGVRDLRTGETTLLLKVEGELSGQGGLLVGLSGSESRSRVMALTLDQDGEPITLTTTRTDVSGRGGLIGGQGLTLNDLGEIFGTVSGSFDAEGTHSLTLTTELDLRDPANREVAMDLFSSMITANLPGGRVRANQAADAYAARVAAGGKISVTEHEGEAWGLGAGAQVALAAKLGFDLGYAASDSRLSSAMYVGDAVNGVRPLVPWTACTG